MAENTREVKEALVPARKKSKMQDRQFLRFKLRSVFKEKQADAELFKRQIEEEDPFTEFYTKERLLVPPFDFVSLYTIYEESDILQASIEAMQRNIDGFGYKLQFLGDDIKDKESAQALAQKSVLDSFFGNVNGEESFATIRQQMREDYEVIGNGGFEVLRNRLNDVQMLYYLPFKRMRIARTLGQPITVTVNLPRNGKVVPVKVRRKFRRFAQISETGKTLRWFKEFGDPRIMDFRTGGYGNVAARYRASEVWHFKHHFGSEIYGVPRWIGAVLQVMGRRSASFVNWDLFQNQGIPPMMILVSGGILNEDSIQELEDIIRSMRGLTEFNRVGLLESRVEGLGIEDKGAAKMELVNLADFRKEDMMFDKYSSSAKDDVRHRYRLPDLYVGQSETFTHATAKAAQTVAEEQVFIPERTLFDEPVNNVLVIKELGIDLWKYISKGPQVVGSEELRKGVAEFAKIGAFSINQAIDQANAAFGLELSKFKEAWANYPLPIVLEVLKAGLLAELEPLTGQAATGNAAQLEKMFKGRLLPSPTDKMLSSDLFGPDETALYRFLVGFQAALDQNKIGCLDHEDDDTSK